MDELLNNAPCGYLSFNDSGAIIRQNKTLSVMLGYAPGEMEGMHVEQIFDVAGRIFYQTHFFPLLRLQDKAEEIFLSLRMKSGEMIPVIANASRETGAIGALNNCVFIPVVHRRKYEDEILQAKRNAEQSMRDNVHLDAARQQLEQQARDLDRKVTRLDQVNSELLQFNYVISHDMQECVRKILMFVQLAIDKKDFSYLSYVLQSSNKLKTINENLQAYTELDITGDYAIVDLNEIIRQAGSWVKKQTGFQDLAVTADDLPEVKGSARQLQLLFFHVFSNSIKFRRGEQVVINISHVIYEENMYRSNTKKFAFAEVLRLDISDNSRGFANEYRDYVFQIFRKLDPATAGAGIGLAICRKIVQNHHGAISVLPEEGKGVTVQVVLPLEGTHGE